MQANGLRCMWKKAAPRPITRRGAWIIAALLAATVPGGFPAARGQAIAFQSENDLYGDGEDRWYTNGARLVVSRPGADRADFPLFKPTDALLALSLGIARKALAAPARRHEHLVAIGQNMYTPHTIKTAAPLPGDRPYAGWLYLEFASAAERAGRRDEWLVSLGVVGPAALARQTQTAVHALVNSPRPLGWANQIPNAPAIQLSYRQSRYYALAGDTERAGVQLVPFAAAKMGTILLAADAGVVLRAGWRLGRHLPARIGPSVVGSAFLPPAGPGLSVEMFAGMGGSVVGTNRLIEGPFTRKAPVTAPIRHRLYELTLGGRIAWKGIALTYGYTLRGREFRGQPEAQAFGHAGLTVSF